ncbi:MAG: hypothetical protein J6U40_03555 [Kiritimatiellae bacterium]|nr:hypothetical protein [Kiritimatiellia bacterium]
MNLTSKRVLASLMAVVALVMGAQAALFQDSFETNESWTTTLDGQAPQVFFATEGTLLKNYKSDYADDTGYYQTFPNWQVEGGTDNSTIVAGTYDFTADSRPALIGENTTTAQYLNLNTEGATITRTVGQALTGAGDTYLDTMIKFAKSDEPPTLDGTYKLALYVNATSNLVVCSSDADGEVETTTVTDLSIDPEQWYRLTIRAAYAGEFDFPFPVYQIFVNGNQIVADDVCTYLDDETDVTWFVGNQGDSTFQSVSFRGTGALDDLTVTDVAPTHTAPTTLSLTVAYDDEILDVYNGDTLLTPDTLVVSPADLKAFAKDWYTVAINADETTATIANEQTLGLGDLITNVTFTATATASGQKVTIGSAVIPEATVAPIGGADQPVGKIAKWALAANKSVNDVLTGFADETSDLYDRYLMNVTDDAAAVPALTIESIECGETSTVIKVATNVATFDFDTINGTLTVLAGTDLANLQVIDLDSAAIEKNGAEATITVPVAAGNFIRAIVK